MDFIQTIIISIVEGLTEFLPVSSTGHMIIAENLLGVDIQDKFVNAFTVIIQFVATYCPCGTTLTPSGRFFTMLLMSSG